MRNLQRSAATAASLCLLAFVAACSGSTPTTSNAGESQPSESGSSAQQDPSRLKLTTFTPAVTRAAREYTSWHISVAVDDREDEKVEGDVEFDGADVTEADLDLSGRKFAPNCRLLAVDGLVYLHINGIPAGKFAVSPPGDPNAIALSSKLAELTPTHSFAPLEAALTSVNFVEDEKVKGELLTEYLLEVDAATLYRSQGGHPPKYLTDVITYNVWLDQDNLMRRATFNTNGVVTTIVASEWGTPVDVEAPRPSATIWPPEDAAGS